MNPQLAALRARHDGLAAEHDGMRAHAVTLVQKCRQAESVNGALQRECSRLRGSMHLGGSSALVGPSPLPLFVVIRHKSHQLARPLNMVTLMHGETCRSNASYATELTRVPSSLRLQHWHEPALAPHMLLDHALARYFSQCTNAQPALSS